MDIEQFRNYCLGKKAVTEGFPFSNLPSHLVFKVAGKMFAITDVDSFESIGLRCDPATIDELRAEHPAVVKPPYYSDRLWTAVLMDNSLPDKLLLEWIDKSYDLAVKKLTKKVRTELAL